MRIGDETGENDPDCDDGACGIGWAVEIVGPFWGGLEPKKRDRGL